MPVTPSPQLPGRERGATNPRLLPELFLVSLLTANAITQARVYNTGHKPTHASLIKQPQYIRCIECFKTEFTEHAQEAKWLQNRQLRQESKDRHTQIFSIAPPPTFTNTFPQAFCTSSVSWYKMILVFYDHRRDFNTESKDQTNYSKRGWTGTNDSHFFASGASVATNKTACLRRMRIPAALLNCFTI